MKKHLQIILSLFSILFFKNSYSQISNTFIISPGISFPSYHSFLGSGGSFFINVRPENHIELFIGTAITKFSGFGYGTGIRINILKEIKWIPFIGFSFNDFYYGHHFYINELETNSHYDPNESSNYYSEPNKFYIPFAGLRRDIYNIFDDSPKPISISILATISYREADIEKNVIFTGGVKSEDYENKINKDLASGFGGALSFIVYFSRKLK